MKHIRTHEQEHDTYMYTSQEEPYKLEAVAGGTLTNATNSGEERGATQLVMKRIMTHELERDTYMYIQPYYI